MNRNQSDEELRFSFRHIGKERPGDIARAAEFCEGYKEFLNRAKTERECVEVVRQLAEAEGFGLLERGKSYQPGERVFAVNRGKSLMLVTFGKRPLSEGIRFNIAHIDSPRLDLKPNPLYEESELSYLKTHYYGGIRKYQWGVTPLAMHGVVMTADGRRLSISIGEEPGDPQFVISDLLPHLAAKQNERSLKDGLRGEELNILVGSVPVCGEEIKEAYKLAILRELNRRFGMTEADFIRAEIEMVPACRAVDVGLDRSLIGAYGQDDRVCAYPAVMAAFAVRDPEYCAVTYLTDKEEIGSVGNTGMASSALVDLVEDLCEAEGIRLRDCLRNSICLSGDVNAAYDPNFSDVFEKQNASYLNHGPVLTKYTGARGKSGSNDASAETMYRMIRCMEKGNVIWQIGELGKVDEGGGGTIALFMGNRNVDTVDLGVPVLAMHAPFEITAKLDVYHTYLAFCAFIGERE